MSADYPARLYVAVHEGNAGDLEFYRRRCAGARSILELGCGDARVLAALAEPGRELVGVDLDGELLELGRARRAALDPELAKTLELVEADMATVELGRRFDRVIIPYGGLYCLLDEAAVDRLFATVARHLDPAGELVLDVWAADGFHGEADPADLDPGWLERVKAIEIDGERWEVLERSSWDRARQRLDVTYVHVRVGDEEAVEGRLPQRYLLAEQLRERLAAAGLELRELWGDFAGAPYDGEASFMIAVATPSSAG